MQKNDRVEMSLEQVISKDWKKPQERTPGSKLGKATGRGKGRGRGPGRGLVRRNPLMTKAGSRVMAYGPGPREVRRVPAKGTAKGAAKGKGKAPRAKGQGKLRWQPKAQAEWKPNRWETTRYSART